jgi:hypothetical protein
MTCERYWRHGIVLVEHGADDPHRDGCDDCARAHASRQELIEAVAMIGDDIPEDPYWQAKVWERIEGTHARPPWRWRWQLAGALAAAAVLVLWLCVGRNRPEEVRPYVAVIESDVPIRATVVNGDRRHSGHVGDHLFARAGAISEIRIYRENRLVLQCPSQQASPDCVRDTHLTSVNLLLAVPGMYDVIIIGAPFALPPSRPDEDVAALETAAVSYEEHTVRVR